MNRQTDDPPLGEKLKRRMVENGYHVCVWMNSSVLLSAQSLDGSVPDEGEQLAAYFFEGPPLPGSNGVSHCLKLVSSQETLFLVLAGEWRSFPKLKQVCLPYYCGDAVPMRGRGGSVLWDDSVVQLILLFERMAPTTSEHSLVLHAEFMRDLMRPMGSAYGASGTAQPIEPDASYVVNGNIWISGDFSCVREMTGRKAKWPVPVFTRMILKVLIEGRQPGGLTSAMILERARAEYLKLDPDEATREKSQSKIPSMKSLGQYFRPKLRGLRGYHPLYRALTIEGHKPATYKLSYVMCPNDERKALAV